MAGPKAVTLTPAPGANNPLRTAQRALQALAQEPGGRRPPSSKTLRRGSSHSESGQASETRNRPPETTPTPVTVKHSLCASKRTRCRAASAARSKSGKGVVASVRAAASAAGAGAAVLRRRTSTVPGTPDMRRWLAGRAFSIRFTSLPRRLSLLEGRRRWAC